MPSDEPSALDAFLRRQAAAAESQGTKEPRPGTREHVRLHLDREAKMWVVSGHGAAALRFNFKSYELAEAEAFRRAGFQKVAYPGVRRSPRP